MVYRPQTALVILLAIGLGACTPALEYPPPAQKIMPKGKDPLAGSNLAVVSEPSINTAIVSDVLGGDPGAMWRWTNQHPRIRVWIQPGVRVSFYAKFTVANDVLKKVGPQTVRMIVNDHVLDAKTYATEGEKIYTKPVPAEVLAGLSEIVVGMDVDPILIAESDKMKLGILLEAIGLTPVGRK